MRPLPALGRYLTAATLARAADAGAAVVVVLAAVERTGAPGPGALALAALMLPHLLAGPVVGVLVDRARHPGLVHAALVAGFGVALGGVALLLGRVPLPVVLALAAAGGCCGPMVLGGLSSRLDDLVPDGRRLRGRALDAATYNVAEISGPAAATALVAAAGAAWAGAGTAAACLTAAAVLLTLSGPARPASGTGDRRVIGDLRAGLRCVLSSPPLRAVTVATCVATFGLGALTPAAVLLGIARQHPTGGGALVAVFAAGALGGSLVVSRLPGWRWPPARVALACLVGCGLPLSLVAVLPASWPLDIALFAAAGIFDGPLLAAVLQVRADAAPPHLRMQVFTLGAGLKTSAAALGAATFTLVAGLGAGRVVALVAATQLLAALAGVAALGTGRRSANAPAAGPEPSAADPDASTVDSPAGAVLGRRRAGHRSADGPPAGGYGMIG